MAKGRGVSAGPNGAALGAFLVGFAAFLWATDALFRYPLVHRGLLPLTIVSVEHFICFAVLFPFVFFRYRRELFALRPAQWCGLVFIGAGASAIATVLFTASFGMTNPSVAILLQKLQPLVVTLLAAAFLKERPSRGFWLWGALALVAGVALSFPDLDFHFARQISIESKGSMYAALAAVLWAIGTVVGKSLLGELKPVVITFWRFGFGAFALAILSLLSSLPLSQGALLLRPENAQALAYVAGISGLAAMLLYYMGMNRASATLTTFMELIFPVTAVLVNAMFLGMPLRPAQIVAALALLYAVFQLPQKRA